MNHVSWEMFQVSKFSLFLLEEQMDTIERLAFGNVRKTTLKGNKFSEL